MACSTLALGGVMMAAGVPSGRPEPVATFSIVAADPETREVGVAVASRFFAVGSVVPWLEAGVGAVATQAYANTSYGPRGLELMRLGAGPAAALEVLTSADAERGRRQLGIVSASGEAATYTGSGCTAWAGGRSGRGYAVQGNILTGEEVVAAMEKAFLATRGDLSERLHAALVAGDAAGGDARGRQSSALVVARPGGGYGGFNDRFIDIRVDDHADPLGELGRLLGIARVNGLWNLAWTAYGEGRFAEALPLMERTASAAEKAKVSVVAEVAYDLAIIRAASGLEAEAIEALRQALRLNPKLAEAARSDKDLDRLREAQGFEALVEAPAGQAEGP